MADVAVVIPAFAAAATLRRTVECARAQAAPQVIVVLDGPDPEADAILADYPDVQVSRLKKQRGAPAARNAGLAMAQTKYVMFLDADDYIEGPLLASAVRAAARRGADLVFGKYVSELPNGARVGEPQPYLDEAPDPGAVISRWLDGHFTPPCATLWRTAFVRELGGWDEKLRRNQDGDIAFRALLRTPILATAPQGLGVYVQHDSPNRIINQTDAVQFDSYLTIYNRVFDQTAPGVSAWRGALRRAFLNLARNAAASGRADIAQAAEARAGALTEQATQPPLRGFLVMTGRRDGPIADELGRMAEAPNYQRVEVKVSPTRRSDVADAGELARFNAHLEILRANAGFEGWLHVIEDTVEVSGVAREAIGAIIAASDFSLYDVLFTHASLTASWKQFSTLSAMFDACVAQNDAGAVVGVKTVATMLLDRHGFVGGGSYLINPHAIERTAKLLSDCVTGEPFVPLPVAFSKLSRRGALSMAGIIPFLTSPPLPSADEARADAAGASIQIAEAALYADRDMTRLNNLLGLMDDRAEPTATGELIARAYRSQANRP